VLDHLSHGAPRDIVLVHGAGGNNLLWSRTMRYLSGDARAVAVNLPGHPSGQITCRTVAEYSEALQGFLGDLGLRRPVLCGHSMGSAVVLSLALAHPDDLGGLVLVSGGAKLGVDPSLLDALRAHPMKAIEDIITPRSFFTIDLGQGRESRAALSISNLPVFLNDYIACRDFDVRSSLPSVALRTLVICGDRDRMTPPKWSHYMATNIPDAELYFIKDAGHMLPLEKPGPLGGLLQSFLQRLTR
jgi:pimeloyl-ACP methyl ester carboxylesterase